MTDVQTAQVPAPRAQVQAGAPVAALVPRTIEEAFRLSTAIATSGLAPHGMKEPEKVLVAIMAGAEIGLAPLQSVQSFAVINGRPTLWGDALVAIVKARGVRVRTWLDGEGDAMIARCEVTRPDTGEVTPGEFSVDDAKKAKLWGKTGHDGKPTPWVTHPKRMLQMRARAFALRDGCADMLRGIAVREEVEDYDHGARAVEDRPAPAEALRIETQAEARPIEIVDAPEPETVEVEPRDALTPERSADDPVERTRKTLAEAATRTALYSAWKASKPLRDELEAAGDDEALSVLTIAHEDAKLALEDGR